MAAGIHGEFELVFTVPAEKAESFHKEANRTGFVPIRLGTVEKAPNLGAVLASGKKMKMDMAPLRNMWEQNPDNLKDLLQQHHYWGKLWGLE
jgi:hypothetical protein